MEIIRPYEEKDRPYVERICIETAGKGFFETPARKEGTLAAFCRVYLDRFPEYCFVAADAGDLPVGYILCAPSYGSWFRQIPAQFGAGFPFGFWWNFGSGLEALPYAKAYPAHLHINLLPGYQRKGLGRQLLRALEQRLAAENCPGIQLGVGSANLSAVQFYERCGFHPLARHSGAILYGKTLEINGR